MLGGKTFHTVNILEHILKRWRKTEDGSLMQFCKRNNIQGGYVFCATGITHFSTVISCMESHFGTADKWDGYADSFVTQKLFVLCCNNAPSCYKHRVSGNTCYYSGRQKACLWGKLSWEGASVTGVKILIMSYSIFIYSLIQHPNGQLQQQRQYKESTEKNQDKIETTIKKGKRNGMNYN